MMGRRTLGRGVLGLFAGGVALVLGGCGLIGDTSYRFRMTVEVQTPQGLKTGSAVYEVVTSTSYSFDGVGRGASARGEALVVDVPGGPIFVLMKPPEGSKHDNLAKMSMAALDPDYKFDWMESARRISGSWSTLRGDVPRADWPMMVRFRDLNDPKSVEKVDPAAIGVKRIALETTGDDVTTGIEKRLGWFSQYLDRHLDGTSSSIEDLTTNSLGSHLSARSFSTEIGR
jgi:hypothetical protein